LTALFSAEDEIPYQVIIKNKSGFINRQGKLLFMLKDNYRWHSFSDGLFKLKEKCTYIDTRGNTILTTGFKYCDSFSEGLAKFSLPDKCIGKKFHPGYEGYFDKTGKIILEPDNYIAHPFSEGLARIDVGGKYGITCPLGRGQLYSYVNGLYGFINKKGTIVIKPQYIRAKDFSEGLAAVWSNKTGRSGFINKKGEVVIPFKYWLVRSFKNGLAQVTEISGKNSKGFIDKKGNYVVQPVYRMAADHFSEGLAWVMTETGIGFVDRKGKFVIKPRRFGSCGNFSEGLCPASAMHKWGYLDKAGQWKIYPQFKEAGEFRDGIAEIVTLNDNIGYIDKKGKYIWKPQK